MSHVADYEMVVGLEVHVHLATRSKLFSPAPVHYGGPPNHFVHPIDLGLPGVLPVLNGRVVELALRAALVTHCVVHARSIFARKNYFYPDLPKGYQISQFEDPLATEGWMEIEVEGDSGVAIKRIGITRIHIEEDAGKSIHDSAIAGGGSHVDLNRAGVPLLEIVSEPDLRSPGEAGAYLRKLRQLLRYLGVTGGDLEKGQFRCDANVSLRPRGQSELGTRTELKNLNSFRFVEAAIAAEAERQAGVLDAGGGVSQATMHFDAERGTTRVMRLKEDSDDYRYFPDPDLIPLQIAPEQIEAVRQGLPELPEVRQARFEVEYGLPRSDAVLLSGTRELADFFEAALRGYGGSEGAKPLANWLSRDVRETLAEVDVELDASALEPAAFGRLVRMVVEGRVTAANARPLLTEMVRAGGDPEALVREHDLEAVSDRGFLEETADAVISDHPDMVQQVRAGEDKVLNFLMGQIMKRTQGKANPAAAREVLVKKIRG